MKCVKTLQYKKLAQNIYNNNNNNNNNNNKKLKSFILQCAAVDKSISKSESIQNLH